MIGLSGATAAAPLDCESRPDHPRCSDTTTTTTQAPPVQTCAEGVITIPGSSRTLFECLWTPEEGVASTGTITVSPAEGAITYLAVAVRDAAPGDICVMQSEWDDNAGSGYTTSFDLAYSNLPDDADWDPDDLYPDFAPYEDQTYWSFGGTHWCYPQDTVAGMRDDPNGKPLHLLVNFRAKKGTVAEVVLSPPQDPTP